MREQLVQRRAPPDFARKLAQSPVGGAAALLSPVVAWPLFILAGFGRHLPRHWLVLWGGYSLPLLIVDAASGRWPHMPFVLLQAGIGIAAGWVFVANGKSVRVGFLAALVTLAVLAVLEGAAYRQVWKSPGENPRTSIEPSLLVGIDKVSEPSTYRLWRRSLPGDTVEITFTARSKSPHHAATAYQASIAVDRVDRDSLLGSDRRRFVVTETWEEYAFLFSDKALSTLSDLRTTLHLQAGTSLEMRNLRLKDVASGERIVPVNPFPRQQLWYGHPNLLAHAVAVGGMALAVLPGALLVSGLGLAFAFVVVLLAGSRSGLAALAVAAAALVAFRARELNSRLLRAAAIAVALGASLVIAYAFIEGESRVAQGQTPRALIAATAMDAVLAAPWLGLGSEHLAFTDYWVARNGAEVQPVHHAHNWWLQNGVTHGFPGLLAGLWFTAWLTAIAWRSGRWRGLVLIACLGALQIVDSTLLSLGVIVPATFILNTLDREARLAEGAA